MDQDLQRASQTSALLEEKFSIVEEVKRRPGRPKRVDVPEKGSSTADVAALTTMAEFLVKNDDRELFARGLLCAMKCREVRAHTDVDKCIPVAEEFVRAVKEYIPK